MITVAERRDQGEQIVADGIQPRRDIAARRNRPVGGHSSAKAWRRTIWTLLTLAGRPVRREDLFAQVAARSEELGDDAPDDPSAALHALRHDLGRLRAMGIGVTYRRIDATYVLEPPPLTLRLVEEELVAAALLLDSFVPGPHGPAVQALLGHLQRLLPTDQRAALASMRPSVRAEIVDQGQDYAAHGPVIATLQRAMRWHQQVESSQRSWSMKIGTCTCMCGTTTSEAPAATASSASSRSRSRSCRVCSRRRNATSDAGSCASG